jgi:hypothetical protein
MVSCQPRPKFKRSLGASRMLVSVATLPVLFGEGLGAKLQTRPHVASIRCGVMLRFVNKKARRNKPWAEKTGRSSVAMARGGCQWGYLANLHEPGAPPRFRGC